MAGATLLPDAASLALEELVAADDGITMVVRACRPTACCPDCGALDLIRICGQLKLWDESLMEGVRNGQADAPAV